VLEGESVFNRALGDSKLSNAKVKYIMEQGRPDYGLARNDTNWIRRYHAAALDYGAIRSFTYSRAIIRKSHRNL